MANSDSKLMSSLPSKIVGSIAVGATLYLAISVWAMGSAHGLAGFKWSLFPVLLLFSAANYLLRFAKWQYYLRVLRVNLPLMDSFIIFMSGLALSITPSKLGEVGRSYFVKQGFGVPISRTAPIVLADRLSDLMALVILSALGAYSFHYGVGVVWGAAAVILAIFLAVTVRPLGRRVLAVTGKLPVVSSRVEALETLYGASADLLDIRRVAWPLLLSVMAWGMEAVGFYITIQGFGIPQGLLVAVFIYAFSTILGAVTLLPGGLGATEGALAGLLKVLNVGAATAALAALIIRAATLWFGVAVGVVFLFIAQRRYLQERPEYGNVEVAKT
jgi:uncharacterized protein (TIRG00374 family)